MYIYLSKRQPYFQSRSKDEYPIRFNRIKKKFKLKRLRERALTSYALMSVSSINTIAAFPDSECIEPEEILSAGDTFPIITVVPEIWTILLVFASVTFHRFTSYLLILFSSRFNQQNKPLVRSGSGNSGINGSELPNPIATARYIKISVLTIFLTLTNYLPMIDLITIPAANNIKITVFFDNFLFCCCSTYGTIRGITISVWG